MPLDASVDVGRRGGLYVIDEERVAHPRFVHLDLGMPVAVRVARSRYRRRQVRRDDSERLWSSGHWEGEHHHCCEHRQDHRGQQSSGLQSRHSSFLSLSSLLVRHRYDINNGATSCAPSFLSRFSKAGLILCHLLSMLPPPEARRQLPRSLLLGTWGEYHTSPQHRAGQLRRRVYWLSCSSSGGSTSARVRSGGSSTVSRLLASTSLGLTTMR